MYVYAKNNKFRDNKSLQNGGAIHLYTNKISIFEGNFFNNNTSERYGGAFFINNEYSV